MHSLEDNLKLAFKAVEYAKAAAPRSANQRYFKTLTPGADQDRYIFLLGLVRNGSNYTGSYVKNADDKWEVDVNSIKRVDPQSERKQVANKVKSIMANGDDAWRRRELDKLVRVCGPNYFFNGSVSRMERKFATGALEVDLQEFSGLTDVASTNPLRRFDDRIFALFEADQSSKYASRYGVGNCGEKSALTAEYLIKNGPEGLDVARLSLDRAYGGVTGTAGDHAFCCIGFENQLVVGGGTTLDAFGHNAVIVDGWMNDAYPAHHHLQWKYGVTYKGSRINVKQFGVRNMVCLSYRKHFIVDGYWRLNSNRMNARTYQPGPTLSY